MTDDDHACARCVAPLASGVKFSKKCGPPVPPETSPAQSSVCPECGSENPAGSRPCACGAPIDRGEAIGRADRAAPARLPKLDDRQPPPQQEPRGRVRVVTATLAAVLLPALAGTAAVLLFAEPTARSSGKAASGERPNSGSSGKTADGATTLRREADVTGRPLWNVGINDAISVAVAQEGAGDYCAVVAHGYVYCWGENEVGQLGDGTSHGPQACGRGELPSACSKLPVRVHGITKAVAVSVDASRACALIADGEVNCWGDNRQGQLGDGSSTPAASLPAPVTGIRNAVGVSVGLDALGRSSMNAAARRRRHPKGQRA